MISICIELYFKEKMAKSSSNMNDEDILPKIFKRY